MVEKCSLIEDVFFFQIDSLSGGRYVIYRWTLAIYCLVAMTLSITEHSQGKWIYLLTSLNYIIGTTYFLFAAVIVTWHFANPRQSQPGGSAVQRREQRMSTVALKEEEATAITKPFKVTCQVHWFLHNLALNICTFVFVCFWVIIAPNRTRGYPPTLHTFLVFDRHGINLVLLIVDFLLIRIPTRILHCIYPSISLGLYFLYNYIYWSKTGSLIYGKTLDYGTRGGFVAGLAIGGMLGLIPLMQLMWFSAYYMKQRNAKSKSDANDNIEDIRSI